MTRISADGALRSFRSFNYRVWASGSVVSNFGTWIQRTAQDWLVLTQLTDHNATALGFVVACQFAPQLLLLPWSGFAADYFDRRKLLVFTQVSMGVLALLLGLLTVTGLVELWHVYVFSFLFGCAAAIDAPVRQTFVSDLVGDTDLPNAVALNSASFNSARLAGPAVAGFLIAAFGTGWAFLINGASYFAVLLSLFFLRVRELHKAKRAERQRGNFTAGFIYVWRRPDLRITLIMLFLIGTFGFKFSIFVATMAAKVFQTDAQGFGVLSSFIAVGTVAGAFLAARRRTHSMGLMVTGATFFGVGCLGAALAPGYWTFAAALVVTGMAALTFMTTTNSMMQLTTAPEMRGRVMALRIAVALGGAPLGAPIIGWIADVLGPRWGLGAGAAAGFSAAIIGALYLRTHHQSEEATAET
ncbi:MFS transporter [Thalassovita mediterranea]|nr:MFS transporter [Thalassovita mediterranea]